MTKIAIIDMGTNTFHLLLADIRAGEYRILYRMHEAVKLGMAGINEGLITESACRRAVQTMQRFRQIIDQHGITELHAYGTSAFRNAINGLSLANEIESRTRIPIRIISGDQEADLIFTGIKAAVDLGDECSAAMDIGAGSVEFIIGNSNKVFWKKSFEIGGQRLLEKFQKHDPIKTEEIEALDQYFEQILAPLLTAFDEFQPVTLIGASGTFDTLSEIYCIRHGIPRDANLPETPFTIDGFYEIHRDLMTRDRAGRMQMAGMIEMRVDMIVVTSCLIRFVLSKQRFRRIRVSTYSLKEGVLASLAAHQKIQGDSPG